MKNFSNIISFSKNSRGVYSIDPILGCKSGTDENPKGCYNDCYAAKIAKLYGYNFNEYVKRNFISEKHVRSIKRKIEKSKLPFIRMGTMGDPSEDWNHTVKICSILQKDNQLDLFDIPKKEIVIITKHWKNLSIENLEKIKQMKICINTSISVLDKMDVLENSLLQYERVKPYCRSILRIVSADFNESNDLGKKFSIKQKEIFEKYNCLDTVLRVSKNNSLVKEEIIKIEESKFLGKKANVSKFNKRTFMGKCDNCSEMCGVNM